MEVKKVQLEELRNSIIELDLEDNLFKTLYIFSQVELFGGVELSSKEIEEILEISRPTCVKIMKTLVDKELVLTIKRGRANYYRINLDKFKISSRII